MLKILMHKYSTAIQVTIQFFFSIRPLPELLPVLGPLERHMTPTLDAALVCSSRVDTL